MKYPKVFASTYWAGFKDHEPEIIENRCFLYHQYEIKGRLRYGCAHGMHKDHVIFDHIEFYKLKDGNILMLTSPYAPEEKTKPIAKSVGLDKIYPVYALSANTYVRVFLDKWDLKAWGKQIGLTVK